MSTKSFLGYVERDGLLHRVSGTSKLFLTIALATATMLTFDARMLVALAVLNVILWIASRIKWRDLALVLIVLFIFIILNNLFIFLFAPLYGTELFGSSQLIADGPKHWDLTKEQLFYQGLVTLKYFAVLPTVLLFIVTTKPSEFASSLNAIGVPYRFAYSVSLALRYIPDVTRDFTTISQAQQARGLDISKNVKFRTRFKNVVAVLMPLLFSSLDRIDSVAAAMELRGFGREKKRTWYLHRKLRLADWVIIVLSLVILGTSIALLVLNQGRFWNPF